MAVGAPSVPAKMPARIEARPVRHPLRWVAAAVVLLILSSLLVSLWNNPNVERDVVGDYLFKTLTLKGIWVTLYLTVVAMVIGIVGGAVIAVMRLSGNPVLQGVSMLYTWIFRGTPALVQIIFWGYMGALYPQIVLGIPFTHVAFVHQDTNALIGATTAAILALGLNEIAYASEIVRGGILGVDRGQTEAAKALGMSEGQTTRRIVLPQAMRVMIPPMGNETITMLKQSSLVSVIAGNDLLTNLQDVYSQNFKVIPLLVVASLWYLALTTVLSLGQMVLERRYARGFNYGSQRRKRWWR